MEKAILILDMPKNCYKCKLQVHNPAGEHICVINRKSADYCASKADECPLKEVPPKYDTQKARTKAFSNWMKGFNECINQILSGGKENV